jgi:hypothetical protein
MQRAPAAPTTINPQQVAQLKKMLGILPGEVTANFIRACKIDRIETLPAAKYDWALKAIEKKISDA